MFRLRYARLAAAACLTVSCGCISLSDHPLFGHKHKEACLAADCCEIGAMPDCEVPIAGSGNPMVGPPVGPAYIPANPAPPANAPQPRLVPTPMSPTTPYQGTSAPRSTKPYELELIR